MDADSSFSALTKVLELAGAGEFPNTAKAFAAAARMMESTWKQFAMGAPMPGQSKKIKNPTGAYAKSIHRIQVRPFQAYIWSDSPYAKSLEDGTPEMDLKQSHPFGPRSRMSKKGVPYVIIPFRHGTPKSLQSPMPEQIYNRVLESINAGDIKKSVVTGSRPDVNSRGEPLMRATYAWGTRIRGVAKEFSNLEGMVAFDIPSGAERGRSGYVTFRVISAEPPKASKARRGWDNSWIIPSRQGLHITESVVNTTMPIIRKMIAKAIEKDLQI